VRQEDRPALFFGRIWAYKGLAYLIRAEPLITAQIPEAKIVSAGEVEDFAGSRRPMVPPHTLIVRNEYVSHNKRTALFRKASIVVLSYICAVRGDTQIRSHGRENDPSSATSLPQ
jgi:hypothetical protein